MSDGCTVVDIVMLGSSVVPSTVTTWSGLCELALVVGVSVTMGTGARQSMFSGIVEVDTKDVMHFAEVSVSGRFTWVLLHATGVVSACDLLRCVTTGNGCAEKLTNLADFGAVTTGSGG